MISRQLTLLFSFWSFSLTLLAQTITGTVVDAITGKPIESVAVYFDNTTLGTTTNAEGVFSIDYSEAIQSTLVISYLGYEKFYISDYRARKVAEIALKEEADALDMVYLQYDDGLTRKQKLRIFRREFLGLSKNARSCRIVNEEDIFLRYNKEDKSLSASAKEPIIIENRNLKYRISYEIIEFETVFRFINLKNADYTPESVVFLGTSFYQDYEGTVNQKTLDKRNEAFYGSVQHFMRSLYNKNLGKHYQIYYEGWITNPWKHFSVIMEKGSDLKRVQLDNDISILYNEELQFQSEMSLSVPEFYIDQYGNYSPIPGVHFSGYMGSQRIGDILPLDYNLN